MRAKKRDVSIGETRPDGTRIEKLCGREYESKVSERLGSDGVIETHVEYSRSAKGKTMALPDTIRPRNIMSNADRRRLGLPLDE